MQKKKVINLNNIEKLLDYFHESLINHSDIDHTRTTTHRARYVLGSFHRLPKKPLDRQDIVLNCLSDFNKIKFNKHTIILQPRSSL